MYTVYLHRIIQNLASLNKYATIVVMDFIFGFFVGYLCKEIVSYLKRLSEYDWNNRKVYKEDWDWLSHEDLP